MEKEKVLFEDENGNQSELEIFLTYHSDKFNKNYIVFYQDGGEELVAGVVDENGDIHDVETDEEYDELDAIIEEYQEEQEKKEN